MHQYWVDLLPCQDCATQRRPDGSCDVRSFQCPEQRGQAIVCIHIIKLNNVHVNVIDWAGMVYAE